MITFLATATPIIVILCIIIVISCITISKLRKQIKEEQTYYDTIKSNSQNYLKQLEDILKQIGFKKQQKQNLNKDIGTLIQLCDKRNKQCQNLNNKIIQIKKKADQAYEEEKWKLNNRVIEFKRVSQESASYFFDNLEKQYEHAEADHSQKMSRLQEEMDGAAAQLQKLKDTRKAAHQALLKQQEVKENKTNYCLIPSAIELQDIYALQHVKKGLHKPRILSMLIWQTYFQPLAKEKFPIILQDKTKMGIYKITNLKTDECYIGQSVDIYKRWTDHCKAGLGIDAPAGNKLYKSMQEYGLQNFSFELLCQCSKEELDEKEKYFIELYQADLYGYNSTKGNK